MRSQRLELHLDLGPGVVDAIPQPDKAVVEPDEQERQDDEHDDEHDDPDHRARL